MFYFLSELHRDNYSLPWTFILVRISSTQISKTNSTSNTPQLLSVSLFTILSLTLTITLHFLHGLNPTLNLVLNASLSLVWAVSFSLLAWWSSSTLTRVCNAENWESGTGISVCRMYKALFSFALLGLVATLAALGLDVHVSRNSTMKGRFTSLRMSEGKRGGRNAGLHELDVDDGIWDTNPHPAALGSGGRGGEGYALPEEQFGYADTGYQGAAGQVGRRSMEERL
jgi:hypothetical protein